MAVQQRPNPLVDISSLLANLAPVFLGAGDQTIKNSGGTATTTTNNLDPAIAAQLAQLINPAGMSKGAAISDSQGAVSNALRQLMQESMPAIANADKGAGVYNSTTTQLMADDLASKTAAAGAKVQLDNINNYAQNSNQSSAIAAQALKGANVTSNVTESPTSRTVQQAPIVSPSTALLAGGGALATGLVSSLFKGIFSDSPNSDSGTLADPSQAGKRSITDAFGSGGDNFAGFSGDIGSLLTPNFDSADSNAATKFADTFGSSMLSALTGDSTPTSTTAGTTDSGMLSSLGSHISDFFTSGSSSSPVDGAGVNFDVGGILDSISSFFGGGSSGSSSSGCFITTAVCEGSGLSDDCEELELLRGFRDSYMMGTLDNQMKIKQYYAEAPGLVASLASLSKEDRAHLYATLLSEFIQPAVEAIKQEDHFKALSIYEDMFNRVTQLVSELKGDLIWQI